MDCMGVEKSPVVMISGFMQTFSEFEINCERVFNDTVCNGCYNRHTLDAGNWTWCPDHENTDRMFECTKSITLKWSKMQLTKSLKKINA